VPLCLCGKTVKLSEIKDPAKRARFALAARYLRARTDRPARARPVAQLEPDTCPGPLAAQKAQGPVGPRILVRVTSIRKNLLDEDNLCEKYHVDLCRYAGIIPDDAPAQVKIETLQRHPAPGEPEHTLIEVI
jgi:hypothetical protein